MAYPKKPIFKDVVLNEATTSIATTPLVAVAVAPCAGTLIKVAGAAAGTFTGTVNVTVKVNGGADIAGGAFNLPAQTGSVAGVALDLNKTGASAVTVNEGDLITFTPSGGTGATIPGAFVAVIRP